MYTLSEYLVIAGVVAVLGAGLFALAALLLLARAAARALAQRAQRAASQAAASLAEYKANHEGHTLRHWPMTPRPRQP
jgi:phage-related minor tail protein